MIKNIKINLDLLESMLYYWKATSEREKVGETFLYTIADNENMKACYSEEFSGESVRRALSAISNREIFRPESKKEGRFWNNNMWMLEDPEYTMTMLTPIKVLNLDEEIKAISTDKEIETVNLVIIPGHVDVSYINKDTNTIYINFFRVSPSMVDDSVTIEDIEFKKYIVGKIEELVK
jgi:hypothetical protein